MKRNNLAAAARRQFSLFLLSFCFFQSRRCNLAYSIMLEKAKDFAVEIVKTCNDIKKTKRESVLTNQLIRSGTSIGANIHESKYGQSTADFINKMKVALKECYESEYWLELLNRTGYLPDDRYTSLKNSCGSIRRMLVSSINTTADNNNQ